MDINEIDEKLEELEELVRGLNSHIPNGDNLLQNYTQSITSLSENNEKKRQILRFIDTLRDKIANE